MNKIEEIYISKLNVIKFKTCDEFYNSDFLIVRYNDIVYYFKVIEIYISNNEYFYISASDIGYYNNISDLSSIKAFKLIGLEVEKVTDKDTIERIAEQSKYI